MSDQTDNLLYRLVYEIPGCEQICELRLLYAKKALQLLKRKNDRYCTLYGADAIQDVAAYIKEPPDSHLAVSCEKGESCRK
ncbi:hypothetical protein [Zhenpiania hominis]|uniref:Uncharacterized protein n=1 Tax=Zhenpiania hominis TaxID=2763644 RepID=A0A923SP97_9FIRM|nr:hypothetical protein [Zhenpiania hominis]MBC6678266.1 hypothetical protein [Zhenpiania hominis]